MKKYIEQEVVRDLIEQVLGDEWKVQYAVGRLNEIPAADVAEVRHGRWIFGQTMGHSWMKCSECCVSQGGQTATFTYCPNCGARMDKEVE